MAIHGHIIPVSITDGTIHGIGAGDRHGVLRGHGDLPGAGAGVRLGAVAGVRPGAGDQATRSIDQMYPDIVPAITARHMATTIQA